MQQQYYKEYYTLERNHWWFTARLRILEGLLNKRILSAKSGPVQILNAGVATGATSEMLANYGEVTSLEYDGECCEFLRTELNMDVIQGSLTELPFEDNSFDVVCAFDVIEHIDDDRLAVQEIKRVLKDDGHIFLTVPAFMFLWSHHDVVNEHFRRYTSKQLSGILKGLDFNIQYRSYFNFALFFPIAAIRVLAKLLPKKKVKEDAESTGSDFEKFNSSGLLNKFLYRLFLSEKPLLKGGVRFPFGVSLMAIGRK